MRELQAQRPDLHIEEVDIVTAPRRTWQDGVRMIPALKSGNLLLSGLWLDKPTVAAFIDQGRTT